ncbi:MAG: hypothetical protein ACI90V_012260 [Bacillariaceae sp.]|jgi:hypothetical protein
MASEKATSDNSSRISTTTNTTNTTNTTLLCIAVEFAALLTTNEIQEVLLLLLSVEKEKKVV